MQENFLPNSNLEAALLTSLSATRMGQYIGAAAYVGTACDFKFVPTQKPQRAT